jgi:hypothetical protein
MKEIDKYPYVFFFRWIFSFMFIFYDLLIKSRDFNFQFFLLRIYIEYEDEYRLGNKRTLLMFSLV